MSTAVRLRRARLRAAAALGIALALPGCAVPLEVGLDDGEANRVFLALDRAGVDATKEIDPSSEGRWRISVAREDVARALAAMNQDALPRPEVAAAGAGKGALVPSEAVERAQLLAATAEGLRSSLEGIDGVLRARVHLAAPEAAGGLLRDTALPMARGSASVLFEYRGATPPVSADSVQRLVAGEAALAALVSVVAVLAGALLVLYGRLSRARAGAAKAEDHRPLDGPLPDRGDPQDSGPREQPAALRRGA